MTTWLTLIGGKIKVNGTHNTKRKTLFSFIDYSEILEENQLLIAKFHTKAGTDKIMS